MEDMENMEAELTVDERGRPAAGQRRSRWSMSK